MEKNMKKKWIYVLDVLVISITVIVLLYFFNSVTPMVIAPLNEENTTNSTVLFELKNADYILIDDNINLTSPEKIFVKDNISINLKPGTYYWKIKGMTESEIRKLTIISSVDLRLRKVENNSENNQIYEVVNSGSEILNVDVYENDNLTGNFILNPEETINDSGNKFIGGKK